MDKIYNLQGGGDEFRTWERETTTSYKNWGKYKTGNMGLELLVCILMGYVGLLVSTK